MNFIEREILAHFRYSNDLVKQAQTAEDVKTLPGVNQILFSGKDWDFVNQFMNTLNSALLQQGQGKNLSGQTINFQNVIKNATQSMSFSGALKVLYDLSLKFWKFVSQTQAKALSISEIKNIISELTQSVNEFSFTEATANAIKPKLLSVLRAWSGSIPA